MFRLAPILVFFYLSLRFVLPLPCSWKTKIAATVLLLLVSQQHLLTQRFFGSVVAPDLSHSVMLIQGWIYGAFFLLALFLLFVDVVGVLFVAARLLGLPLSLPFSWAKRAAFLVVLALAVSAYGEWQAMRVPDVRAEEVTLDRLPPALDGLVLVQVSDLHASTLLQGPRVREVVDKILAQKPDLILLTGDLVDGTPEARADDVAPLRDLRARYGVFGCVGNHEYYSQYSVWMAKFAELGITMLANEHKVVSVRGLPLVIAGVTDPAASRYMLPEPDIHAALSGAPQGAPVILLAHQPRDAQFNSGKGVDLQLSGHTHGGQFLGAAPLSKKYNNGFVSGWYTVDEGPTAPGGRMQLYVSRGAGVWSGYPLRLGVPAEITRITLRAPQGAQ